MLLQNNVKPIVLHSMIAVVMIYDTVQGQALHLIGGCGGGSTGQVASMEVP